MNRQLLNLLTRKHTVTFSEPSSLYAAMIEYLKHQIIVIQFLLEEDIKSFNIKFGL